MLKNKMSSFVFNNFSKSSYKLISKVPEKEEIYYKNNRLVVLIEDKETGKRIYDVIKSLKDWNVKISSNYIELQIEGYVADKENTVQMFFANIHFDFTMSAWEDSHNHIYTKLNKLKNLVSFTYAMQENGYLIDDNLFDKETCQNLSDFLSFFRPNSSETEASNGCIIKYIHYALTNGGNLEEYYASIVEENKIYKVSEYPYCIPVINMCYSYYLNGSIPKNINDVLEEEKQHLSDKSYSNYLVVYNPDLSSQLSVTEKNDEYTVYDGRIKIYNNQFDYDHGLDSDFEKFFKEQKYCAGKVRECYKNGIVNYEGKTIGYQYQTDTSQHEEFILEKSFNSQKEIIEFVSKISDFIFNIINKFNNIGKEYLDNFNIETDIIYTYYHFELLRIHDLYNLVLTNTDTLKRQITMVFFKLLLAYLKKTYGELSNRNQILEKKEVRYLSPIIAKEFIEFAMWKTCNIFKASEVFYEFINIRIKYANNELVYDKKFLYNPLKSISFLFQHEVENKYQISVDKNNSIVLPDGRRIITFSDKKRLDEVYMYIEDINDKISECGISLKNEYVKLSGVSDIIYSTDLDEENMYYVVGYITNPFHGIPITRNLLLGFSNKEILELAGKLMCSFNKYYIDWKNCLIDIDNKSGKFTFYIDILDSNIRILRMPNDSKKELVKRFFEFLENNDYNPNAFIGLELPEEWELQSYLINYANALDTYCNAHKIYYDSNNKMCPICLETQYIIDDDFEQNCKKVFEDNYAVHYQLNSKYNLKVYKGEIEDIESLKKNVEAIIAKRLKGKDSSLIQDCFIPYKKALNKNQQFIGYIYTAVDFNSENCTDIKYEKGLNNKARIMSLIRLVEQAKTLIHNGYSFSKNPFGTVFLCKDHKKQVQIVNVDLLIKDNNLKATKKWIYKYVYSSIQIDENIDLNKNLLDSDLDKLLDILQKFAQELTKYCPNHKFYYSSDNIFCPKCIDKFQMENIGIEYVNDSEISTWKYDNQGGESTIYLRNDGSIAKVFKLEEINYDFKNQILGAIFGKKNVLDQINKEKHKFKYIIPKKLLVRKKDQYILGYVMQEKVNGVPISTLKDTQIVKELGFQRKDILEVLITVGEGIQTLHDRANIYIGDLNGRNILVDNEKNVYFLDFDGMGVDNIAPLFSTEGYIDPISRKMNNITKKDDWYSFAIQAFYYLTYTHPFNGVYKVDGNSIDIPDKMELKLSLLGNHGIVPPSITEPWDWMNGKLKNAFYNIFEGESRTSIVPELKEQYNEDYGEIQSQTDNSIIRINSKFVARKNNYFEENDCDIVRVINNHSAICKENNDYYAVIYNHGTKYKVHFTNCMEIVDILYLKAYAIAVYHDKVVGFDLNTDEEVFFDNFNYELERAVVNEDTLYLTKVSSGKNIISKVKFDTSTEIKRNKIKFLSDEETVGFLVKFNSKFMTIKRDNNGTDAIYCNSEKLCDINSSSKDSKYNILYDETTKLWLVIMNNGTVITINSSNGHYKELNIPIKIDDMNVRNVAFNSGILYIPSQDCLYIINVKKEMTTKQMECDKLITPDSRLCNFNSNGFSIITDYVLYDIYKE